MTPENTPSEMELEDVLFQGLWEYLDTNPKNDEDSHLPESGFKTAYTLHVDRFRQYLDEYQEAIRIIYADEWEWEADEMKNITLKEEEKRSIVEAWVSCQIDTASLYLEKQVIIDFN